MNLLNQMALGGDKLGPYEILAPVGKGDMGEVYRAHDSRLNRDVAINVLHAPSLTGAERLRFLIREGKRRIFLLINTSHVAFHTVDRQEVRRFLLFSTGSL